MEAILARALEYTLKYWLKSFSRDQFKLQGRTAQLSNLDLDGDALHASVGLPPALSVTTARVGKLEITLPPVSCVQTEPILVQVDRLDLVLEENPDASSSRVPTGAQASSSTSKGGGYGFADKIADGMTLEVSIVNILLETHAGARQQGGATWASPLASITIRNLLLYTTNEKWQVVGLKEARDFSNNKKCIYVFKKMEWASLSLDLLPHPDMFSDARFSSSNRDGNKRDDDGAKRMFFGGERLLDGISAQAYITIQRTELNSPLGLEVRLHVNEVVCPALSEPGLRAFLRFMTGLYVCLNRGDVNPKSQKCCTEVAGRSIVSIIIDHIFLCIKDADFQLELLMQSLFFSRASVSSGESTKNLSCIMVCGFFLRDTFVHPPCTLIQPSMRNVPVDSTQPPSFSKKFCPTIYPLEDQQWQFDLRVPLFTLHSLQIKPSPAPPSFASETFISCQPLMICLQEESCLRISSFLSDGIVVSPCVLLPDYSINSLVFSLKEFDLTIPIDDGRTILFPRKESIESLSHFSCAWLHVENLCFSESPSIQCCLLNLEKDPACFSLWEHQPVDASQRKWTIKISHLSISLETSKELAKQNFDQWSAGLWRCVELQELCLEAAMVTADGSPLLHVPPAEGVVRIGVACEKYLSNTSVEQLFFVLDLYNYLGEFSENISRVNKARMVQGDKHLGEKMMKMIPSDTSVSLNVSSFCLNFLESSVNNAQGMPLVRFDGHDLALKVSHRTLGGAFAVTSSVHLGSICIDCVDGEDVVFPGNGMMDLAEYNMPVSENGYSHMRAIFWIDNQAMRKLGTIPFLDIKAVHVMPYNLKDMECHSLSISAKFSGVRLGGGMSYTESVLHRFGIIGPDGCPGEGLCRGLKNISSGPLAKLFKASHLIEAAHDRSTHLEDNDRLFKLGMPDDVDLSLELNDWLFALEGARKVGQWFPESSIYFCTEERCWHSTFRSLKIKSKSNPSRNLDAVGKLYQMQKFPLESIIIGLEGLQAWKPRPKNENLQQNLEGEHNDGKDAIIRETDARGGVDVETCLARSEEESAEGFQWAIENIKFSVKHPIEAVVTKDELEHLVMLFQSEVDSMGRIVVGVLRLLKLDKTIGDATLDQLSNLGSVSLGRVQALEKLSGISSGGSSSSGSFSIIPFCCSSSAADVMEGPNQSLESIVGSLDAEISDSQAKCSLLLSELNIGEGPSAEACRGEIQLLNEKLESMQALVAKLQTRFQKKP